MTIGLKGGLGWERDRPNPSILTVYLLPCARLLLSPSESIRPRCCSRCCFAVSGPRMLLALLAVAWISCHAGTGLG